MTHLYCNWISSKNDCWTHCQSDKFYYKLTSMLQWSCYNMSGQFWQRLLYENQLLFLVMYSETCLLLNTQSCINQTLNKVQCRKSLLIWPVWTEHLSILNVKVGPKEVQLKQGLLCLNSVILVQRNSIMWCMYLNLFLRIYSTIKSSLTCL